MQGPDGSYCCQTKTQELPKNEQDEPGARYSATVDVTDRAAIRT